MPYPTHVHGLLVRHRDVSHTTAFRTFKQLRKLFNVMSLDNGLANKPDIHAFTASSSSRCSGSEVCERRQNGLPRAREAIN